MLRIRHEVGFYAMKYGYSENVSILVRGTYGILVLVPIGLRAYLVLEIRIGGVIQLAMLSKTIRHEVGFYAMKYGYSENVSILVRGTYRILVLVPIGLRAYLVLEIRIGCFEYIEEMIHKQEPLVNVLRLLILFSVTNAGLPKKNFDYLRQVLRSLHQFLILRELLHSYGFEHMATLNNLEKAGLFRKQESKSNWLTVKRALQLVVEDTDTANPNDISYVFSGYAPLSIRLVQHAVRSGWRPVEEILKLLPGPHSESKRSGFASSSSLNHLPGAVPNMDKVGDGRRSLVLVVFIGGVTCAEISALRFLSAQEGMAYDLIVGTTKIVTGHTLTETFIENLG
ncbi:hypothetical protein TEA_029426 [Camellia sinensis var. sinensis]|uniref:Uncharacterized protein n=1 Tax=Camellia sinensis var. sinensis TaxID=542762 RepID=A0A4S4D5V8_CAMSN|nr:hypothetical protein TEA_029426 [Camellia sinensis var. sinensis]